MTPPTQPDSEITLLDVLVVLAENFWLLVLTPLALGSLAFGIASFIPKTYESTAVLRPLTTFDEFGNPQGESTASMAARLKSPDVQEQAAESEPWIRERQLNRRQMAAFLREAVQVRSDIASGLVVLTTRAPSAEQAQAFAGKLLQSYLATASPRGPAKEHILNRIKVIQNALSTLEPAIEANANTKSEKDEEHPSKALQPVSRSILADLVAQRTASETELHNLQKSLDVTMAEIVLQSPTFEEKPILPKRMRVGLMAAILSALSVATFVFMRAAADAVARNPECAPKLARIRRGLLRR